MFSYSLSTIHASNCPIKIFFLLFSLKYRKYETFWSNIGNIAISWKYRTSWHPVLRMFFFPDIFFSSNQMNKFISCFAWTYSYFFLLGLGCIVYINTYKCWSKFSWNINYWIISRQCEKYCIPGNLWWTLYFNIYFTDLMYVLITCSQHF